MSDLESLIERLAALSGPDRVTDGLIYGALKSLKPCGTFFIGIGKAKFQFEHPDKRMASGYPSALYVDEDVVPRYSESIDAALTLLLPHHSFELTQSAVEPPALSRARIWDWRRGPLAIDPGNEWKSEGNRTLVINLCIAALRARAQAEEDGK